MKLDTRQTLVLSTSDIAGFLTFPETILGTAGHVPEVPHAACACGLSPDGLGRPVVCKTDGTLLHCLHTVGMQCIV